jgi:hypothetical protein
VTTADIPLEKAASSPDSARNITRPLLIAGAASISAGVIHAGAIGAHSEHPQTAKTFAVVALLQVAWGAFALIRPTRRVAVFGTAMSGVFFIAWVAAKMRGLPFIDGLGDKEPVQFADGLCAALALVSTIAAGKVAFWFKPTRTRPMLATSAAFLLVALALPGMIEAGNHVHSHGSPGQAIVVGADGKAQVVTASAAVPTHPYIPGQPIDLGGVPGVTPEQQARAENLVAETLIRLPQLWSDPAAAEAAGFKSIGDGVTGDEHLINWAYINDDHILDPDHPESLVYNTRSGHRVLESAMYMLAPGSSLTTVPDIGGALTQWHIHDNLCFTNDIAAPHVAGLTDGSGNCRPPTVKLDPVPMIHVWITPNPCGPFAALTGVGAGQVLPGQTASCDHVHGANGTGGL